MRYAASIITCALFLAPSLCGAEDRPPTQSPDQPPEVQPQRVNLDGLFRAEFARLCLEPRTNFPAAIKSEQDKAAYAAGFERMMKECARITGAARAYYDSTRPAWQAEATGMADAIAIAETLIKPSYKNVLADLRKRTDSPRYTRGMMLVRYAIAYGDLEGLDFLAARVPDLDTRDESGETPLCSALRHRSVEMVELLLKRGASLASATNSNGDPPIFIAAHPSTPAEMLPLLLKHGVDVHARNADGQTPLFLVKDKPEFDLLVKAGVDPKAVDHIGRTALHNARNAAIARLLLDAGANLNAETKNGTVPVETVRDADVRALLVHEGARIPRNSYARRMTFEALDRPFRTPIKDVTLLIALSHLYEVGGGAVEVNWRALRESGIKTETVIDMEIDRSVSAQQALRQVFGHLSEKIVFDVDSTGTILIGTPETVKRLMAADESARNCLDPKGTPKHIATAAALLTTGYKPHDELSDLYSTSESELNRIITATHKMFRLDLPALQKAGFDPKHVPDWGSRDKVMCRRALDYVLSSAGATEWSVHISDEGEVLISTPAAMPEFIKSLKPK